ncbi:MAG: HD domain-containing protein [Oscillospiraceae bacterium]|nr:HD domain-containing protein [Oscillospiraceae bacterium]
MFTQIEISILDFAFALLEVVDLMSPELHKHHKQVAYISCKIAQEIRLPDDDLKNIFLAAILHDIGDFMFLNQSKADTVAAVDINGDMHAEIGYELLRKLKIFTKASTIIRHHHANHTRFNFVMPLGSFIIQQAGKLVSLTGSGKDILEQAPAITEQLAALPDSLHPEVTGTLRDLCQKEYFWIEMCNPSLEMILPDRIEHIREIVDLETLESFARVTSHLIDFKSRFTASHSSGVAAVAAELAAICNYSKKECQLVKIAGLLHDIGKIAIPNDILEKNGRLTNEEYSTIKKHAYFTYSILNKINGLEQIVEWAAFHHEKLDGAGYPFHIRETGLPELSRIIAIADILTALMENRPYRAGMRKEDALGILDGMAKNNQIDKQLLTIVNQNIARIDQMRIKAQREETKEYEAFNARMHGLVDTKTG